MNKYLQFKIIALSIAAVFVFASQKANASHAMGADLTYQCLGGNTYKLRLSFYRDCIGINAPSSVYVKINSASCGQNLGITCKPITGTGQEVTAMCPAANSTCNGGSFTGIQEWIYEGTVTLPMQCSDWIFSYSLCCRNAAISTITNPGSSTFYIYATLNNTISPCNSSPTFTNKPVPFSCLGQQFQFNHGAVDPDGDSLAYTLVNPMQTVSNPVNYINPYSATDPLNSVPALQFNTATGDITFNPQQLQVTVMSVLVQEFRNGVLIGSVIRDIQITVINCTNDLPSLSGINGTNNFNATICANVPYCFNIFSNDLNAGQQLNVTWNAGIDSATFTTAGTPHPTGTFCWTPSVADIASSPHCFTARVNDDACPYLGSQTYSYCLTVTGLNMNAGPDQAIACSDLATIAGNVSGGNPPYSYQWSNGYTGQAQTVGIGTYIVTASDGNCSATDTVNVISAFEPAAGFNWTGGCAFSPVNFNDQSTTPAGIITNWYWDFGDLSGSTLQNPIHVYSAPGTYQVTLVVVNNLGCNDTIVQPVVVLPIPSASFTTGNACMGSTTCFNNTSVPSGSSWWYFGNGDSSQLSNPCTTFNSAGTYTVTLVSGDTLGCVDTISQSVIINPLPIANFTNSIATCQNGNITFTSTSSGNPTGYWWSFGDGDTSTLQNPIHDYSSSGNYIVTLVVINQYGCSDTITHSISINPPPFANAGPDQAICLGSNVTLTATGGVSYQWNPGGDTTGTIIVSPSSGTTYTVIVTDANGCSSADTIAINVNPLPNPTVSPDQSVCAGQSVILIAGGGVSYEWNPTGATTSTITVTPGSSTTYAVNVIDANGCQATAFVNITIHQNPTVNMPTAVFTCTGVNTLLDPGNVGTSYQWSNGSTSQTISVSQQGIYTVTVTNQFGCTASGSTQVSVGGQVVNNANTISICQGNTTVINAGFAGSTYQWNNGSTAQTITVSNAGNYNVTITDANGCSGTVTNTVMVNVLPLADFTPNNVCINDPMLFHDISTINNGSITSWNWNFGDGNVSQQQNPQHIYQSTGTWTVSLIVTSNSGCADTVTKNFSVYPLPTVNFIAANSCQMQSVQFTDLSSIAVGNLTGWNWNFGDGNYSSQQNPSHPYQNPGTYFVTLNVTTAGGCSDSLVKQVIVYPKPDANFTATQICLNSPTSFTNTSSVTGGTITNWLWDFGNGLLSAQQNPSYTYAAAGTYNVSLIITTSNGCSDTIIQPVIVKQTPNADAGTSYTVCRNTPVTLTGTGGVSYSWTPGGATSASIIVTPAVTTTYYVIVTGANGCTATDSVKLSLKNLPVADAGPDKQICVGTTTSLTAAGGVSYLWNPGGLTTSTINVNPTSTTQYIVIVTGANGCSNNDTAIVTVNPLPLANAGPDQTICEGSTIALTASGGTSYNWQNTGATTATIYINPTAPTAYIVNVIDSTGCQNKDTVNISLNPTPVVNLTPSFFCIGFSTTLDAAIAGAVYEWQPNGETTQTISVSAAGTYTVLVTNSFGCQGLGSTNVVEGGTGLSGTPTNVLICQGNSITLDAGNPGLNYSWSTGAITQTISVNTSGSYSVTVTDGSGCTATFINNVTVNPLPVVGFTSSNSCLGNITQFTNTSTISTGTIANYFWTFGNGYSSSLQNPSQLYSTSGAYNTTLQVTSGFGCVASATVPVTVAPLPIADFSTTTVCNNNATQFTDLSTLSSGSITAWNWNFGNGNISSNQNPSFTFATDGTYNVMLVVSSGTGCNDTTLQSVTINPKPIAAFNGADVCEGDSTVFINLSSINNGGISDYTWDFGDQQGSSLENPTHLYATAGIYAVTLMVGSDHGCMDTLTKTINVNARPIANFSTPPACHTSNSIFNDNSTANNGNVNGWYWSFGDGGSSNQHNTTHQYNNPGSYTVTLVATSDKGCSDTLTRNTIVNPLPVINFSTQDVCFGSATQFTDASAISSGTLNSWNWNFGDNTISSQQNPTHQYPSAGTYNAQLIVSSNNGCLDTLSHSVNVFPLPAANFSSGNVCYSNITSFFDQSQVTGGGNFTYLWDFGDGTTDSVANPQHAFINAGIYNVSLTVSTANGCTATIIKNVKVYPLPVASFTAGNVCLMHPTIFLDGSTVSGSTITGWNWNFGDSIVVTFQNPVHQYESPGWYNVSLQVTSEFGCRANTLDSVQIYTPPTPQIAATTGCLNDNLFFSDTSSGTNNQITNYYWEFDHGIYTSTIGNPNYSFNTPGLHTITLTTTNNNGCSSTRSININVSPLPVADFEAAPSCANSAMQFNSTSTISSGSIIGYQWNFGDSAATASTQQNPSFIYTQPGTYNVTLIVTSNDGCHDTIIQQVTVHPLPTAAFHNISAAGCGPVIVQFNDSSFIPSGNVVSWHWDFGDGGTSELQNPSHAYSISGNYSVTLTVTSDSGCTNSVTMQNIVTVYPSPQAGFEPDAYTHSIDVPTFEFQNLSTGGNTYNWTFGDGGNSTAYEPTHSYPDTGWYHVTLWVTNSFGCWDSISKNVYVEPLFEFYIPNAFTPNADGSNDGFNVKGIYIVNVDMNIYNRWGDLIYHSAGRDNADWDGSVQGHCNGPASEGVYVYDISVKDVWGKTHQQYGHVNLVR